jgi:sugar O-acyltransferase (sialic acid O-acetyltransferase NeuD family)
MSQNWTAEFIGFTDLPSPDQETIIDGLPYLGVERAELLETAPIPPTHFICAIGDNKRRKKACEFCEQLGLTPFTVIDPSVLVAPEVTIGGGTYVGAGSVLSPAAKLGRHVIINHGCSIGHDSELGDFSQACPGTRVSGWVKAGEGVMLGSNCVAAPRVEIGAWATLGAASFANRDIPSGSSAIGVPIQFLFRPKK